MWYNSIVWKKSSIKEPTIFKWVKKGTSCYGLWLEIQKLCVGWSFINLDLGIKDIEEVN
jgi:hypothetical protein